MTEPAESRDAIREQVERALRRMLMSEELEIGEQTELYYDLGLGGEDLVDAVDEVFRSTQTNWSELDLSRYGPNEIGHNFGWFGLNFVREFREWRGERTYQSLTVGRLIDAAVCGEWKGQ